MGLIRSMAPGIALGGVALGLVAGFDRAITGAEAPTPKPRAAGDATDPGSGATCADGQTITGDTIPTRWGPVQVRATVTADGQVCDSEAVVYPDGDRESISINAYALPIIEQQVQEQGVSFDGVSGATYTCEGYRQSLQSVLDQL